MRASAVDLRTEGLDEIMAALEKIDAPHLDVLLRKKAIPAAARPMVKAVKSAAPRWKSSSGKSGGSTNSPTYPGGIAKSIGYKAGRRSRPPAAIVRARARNGGWISHFVIGGTKPHSLAKEGSLSARLNRRGFRSPGTRPNPYMTRGGKAGTPAALRAMESAIRGYWKTL